MQNAKDYLGNAIVGGDTNKNDILVRKWRESFCLDMEPQ